MDFPPIEEKLKEWHRSQIKQLPQNNLRASSLGHPCDRFHYHSIVDWKLKELHNETLQSIFAEGNHLETIAIHQLQNAGFKIIETQRPFQLEKPLITMHIDGILEWEGRRYPFDIKSISGNLYPQMRSAEDFMFSKHHWHRNYIAQMQLYLLGTGEEFGMLILKNKNTGEMKQIPMQLDVDFCEKLLQRAERVYDALSKKTPPKRTDIMDLCLECPFRHVCLPDLTYGPGVQNLNNETLEIMLDRREELLEGSKEFKELDEQIKSIVTESGEGEKVVGKYLIRVSKIEKVNKIPLTWDEEKTSYLKTQIVRMEK